ncbi:MAG: A/G-specific adenine glycosylase, partial [Bacteroidetes bacterium]|nr:A/G-specific adenine glycosylase [Bacteroidota bacterium]
IMEFGSQFCKPVNPDCSNCIFRSKCAAFLSGNVQVLPVKAKKTKIRNRYLNYLVLIDKNNQILVNKRQESDIWKGLYEFTLVESETELSEEKVLGLKEVKRFIKSKNSVLHISKTYKHILSHQHLFARFYVIRLNSSFTKTDSKCSLKSLRKYAFPRLIEKFLNDCKLTEIV